MIATIIIAAVFFVSGFGFGWCLRGDRRYVVRERDITRRVWPEIEREIFEGLARERAALQQKKDKERSRWN